MHNFCGDGWKEGTTCHSNQKWAWDRLMSRLRNGETDPHEDDTYKLQPVIAKGYDYENVSWDQVEMTTSGNFFLK